MQHVFKPTLRAVALSALLAQLAACGGGGGGGDAGGVAVAATPLAITASNQVVVAQESLSGALSVGDAALLITGAQVSSDRAALDFVLAQMPKLGAWLSGTTPVVSGATSTSTVNCDAGSMSVTVNDANNNRLIDGGDSFTIVAQNCMFRGATLNGTLALGVNSASGDLTTDVYSASLVMTLTNLVATDPTGTVTANGTLNANVASTAFNTNTFSMSTSSYAEVSIRAGVTYRRSLTDFRSTLTTTPNGGGFTESLVGSGTLVSSGLNNQSVTFATVTPVVRNSTQTYPSSGVATVTGASGSKIRLTVQNATSVAIDLDANGDGTFEATQTKLWTDLI